MADVISERRPIGREPRQMQPMPLDHGDVVGIVKVTMNVMGTTRTTSRVGRVQLPRPPTRRQRIASRLDQGRPDSK
jgi:hypothetical protein